jgi:L-threonylcarbamoyladenylate synthase
MTDDELSFALAALTRGAAVAAATETFFGLLVDPTKPGALDALFALKGRQAEKGVALLVPAKAAWRTLVVEIPELAEKLADHFWPGPLTIALAARAELDPRLTVAGTVAARCPGPSDAARIVAAFGAPLTATSANRAGAPACVTGDEVKAAFPEALGAETLVVVPGIAPGGEPSTLVAVTRTGPQAAPSKTTRAGGPQAAPSKTTAWRIDIVRSGPVRQSDLLSLVGSSALR